MKTLRLHSYCRTAVQIPRKQARLCLYDHSPHSASHASLVVTGKPFSSTSGAGRRRTNNDDGEAEERARYQLAETSLDQDFKAAPPINFEAMDAAEFDGQASSHPQAKEVTRRLRVVPQSPSYFSSRPRFTDDYIHLHKLFQKYGNLPKIKAQDARRVLFEDFKSYSESVGEDIRPSRFHSMREILKQLNYIHPKIMPAQVKDTLRNWAKSIQPYNNRPAPIEIDEFGRAEAVGRRKSSSAKAWVVEGEGEVLVNGSPLHKTFARVHDRESVLWALKTTNRIDKYNVFGMVHGGGTTGQAEALALAVSKALMGHEPMLKTFLRKVGCVARDPRRVERKKPGKLKARKMPAWVKR